MHTGEQEPSARWSCFTTNEDWNAIFRSFDERVGGRWSCFTTHEDWNPLSMTTAVVLPWALVVLHDQRGLEHAGHRRNCRVGRASVVVLHDRRGLERGDIWVSPQVSRASVVLMTDEDWNRAAPRLTSTSVRSSSRLTNIEPPFAAPQPGWQLYAGRVAQLRRRCRRSSSVAEHAAWWSHRQVLLGP